MNADLTAAERAEQLERLAMQQAERLAEIENAVGLQYWRKRFMPQFNVTMPKYVIMDNPRLGVLYYFVKGFFLVIFVGLLVFGSSYRVMVRPDVKVSMCGSQCPTDAYLNDSLAVCPDTSSMAMLASSEYNTTQCAKRCGAEGTAGACLHAHERYKISKYGESGAWIPTYYSEEVSVPANLSAPAGDECPSGLELNDSKCTNSGSYFVAGADEVRMAFTHEISVLNSDALLSRDLYRSHQGAFHSDGGKWDEAVTTRLFNAKGEEVEWWGQSNGGRFVNVTLRALVEAAWHGGVPEEEADGTVPDKVPLSIDTGYIRPEVGVAEELPLRLTGAVITVDLFVTDTGVCKVFDTLRQDPIRTVKVDGGQGKPVACMFVHVDQQPTYELESLPVGLRGGARERRTHGFRVRFRSNGEVPFMNEIAIVRRVTMFCILMQIPLVLVRFFVVTFLGTLSKLYSRVMNQELNLAEACKGLAARLISHSGPFVDLMDGQQAVEPKKNDEAEGEEEADEEQAAAKDIADEEGGGDDQQDSTEMGISKDRILARIREFLEYSDVISDQELLRMVDFLHQGLKGMTEQTKDLDLVNLSDFCTACCTNEPLSFDSLVQLFDKDRKTGVLERIFVDDDISAVHHAASRGNLNRGASLMTMTAGKTQGGIAHSNLNRLLTDVQALVTKVTDAEVRARDAGREVDLDDDTMDLLGEDTEAGAFTFPEPLQASHRESCTVTKVDPEEPSEEIGKS